MGRIPCGRPEAALPDLTVDASGKFCPIPIVEVAKAIRAVRPGQIVEIVATDPGVESDLEAWCKSTRHELVGLWREGGTYRAFVRRKS